MLPTWSESPCHQNVRVCVSGHEVNFTDDNCVGESDKGLWWAAIFGRWPPKNICSYERKGRRNFGREGKEEKGREMSKVNSLGMKFCWKLGWRRVSLGHFQWCTWYFSESCISWSFWLAKPSWATLYAMEKRKNSRAASPPPLSHQSSSVSSFAPHMLSSYELQTNEEEFYSQLQDEFDNTVCSIPFEFNLFCSLSWQSWISW